MSGPISRSRQRRQGQQFFLVASFSAQLTQHDGALGLDVVLPGERRVKHGEYGERDGGSANCWHLGLAA